MAYSKEKRTNQMIAKLEKQLKPGAGRMVSSAEQRRIKSRLAILKESAAKFRRAAKEVAKPAISKPPSAPKTLAGKPRRDAAVGPTSRSQAKTAAKKNVPTKKASTKKETAKQATARRQAEYRARKASVARNKAAHTPSATDKANAAKAAQRSGSRKKRSSTPTLNWKGGYSKLLKKLFG